MIPTAALLKKNLIKLASPQKAVFLPTFFKTGKGQYGEGDRFLGIAVPDVRQAIKPFIALGDNEIIKLLVSDWHEVRLAALLLWVYQFERGNKSRRRQIFNQYKMQIKYVNNWDLVDVSAPNIVGTYLQNRSRKILLRWAKSKKLFERRVAIIATLTFIRNHDFEFTMALAKELLTDKEDLMHKAVGWMLREAGKRDLSVLTAFLDEFTHTMPRTMLRYAIEKLTPEERQYYLTIPRS